MSNMGKKGPVKRMYIKQIHLDNISSSHLDLSQHCLHYPGEGDKVVHPVPHHQGLAFSS